MVKKLGRWIKCSRSEEEGFTLIELLVVVAILGVLAVVAVPNVGKFIGEGKIQAQAAELHNISTAVMALMTESTTGQLDQDYTDVEDLTTVTAPGASGPLSDFVTGLNGGNVQTGVQYDITALGKVTQHPPAP